MARKLPKQDPSIKDVLERNEIFADLFNAFAFHGNPVLRAEELQPADTAYADVLETTKGFETIGKYRDKVRKTARGTLFVILAVEAQDKVHYAEPVKVMLYDALSYTAECKTLANAQGTGRLTADEYLSRTRKGTKLTPVFTLVLYTGEKPWDGPRSLYDMLDIHERLKPFVPDYPINMIDLGHDEDIPYQSAFLQKLSAAMYALYHEMFDCDLVVENEVLSIAAVLANDGDLYKKAIENEGGAIRMCEALKKLRDLGKLEMLFSLVEDGSLTVDRGADKIGMTLEEFKDSYEEWLKGKEK